MAKARRPSLARGAEVSHEHEKTRRMKVNKTTFNSMLMGAAALAGGLLSFNGTAIAAPKLPANCSEAKPTIGVALPNTVNPYYIAMQDSFKKNGAAQGFNVNVATAND